MITVTEEKTEELMYFLLKLPYENQCYLNTYLALTCNCEVFFLGKIDYKSLKWLGRPRPNTSFQSEEGEKHKFPLVTSANEIAKSILHLTISYCNSFTFNTASKETIALNRL